MFGHSAYWFQHLALSGHTILLESAAVSPVQASRTPSDELAATGRRSPCPERGPPWPGSCRHPVVQSSTGGDIGGHSRAPRSLPLTWIRTSRVASARTDVSIRASARRGSTTHSAPPAESSVHSSSVMCGAAGARIPAAASAPPRPTLAEPARCRGSCVFSELHQASPTSSVEAEALVVVAHVAQRPVRRGAQRGSCVSRRPACSQSGRVSPRGRLRWSSAHRPGACSGSGAQRLHGLPGPTAHGNR